MPWKPARRQMRPHIARDRGEMGVCRIEDGACEAARVLCVTCKLANPLTSAHEGRPQRTTHRV